MTARTTTWRDVHDFLRSHPPGEILRLPKYVLPHPEDAGAARSVGLPLGQAADFRWRLRDCRSLHVRDFQTHYEAHIDFVDPSCDPVEHLRRDLPEGYVGAVAAIGGLLGALIGGSREAAVVGAGLGAAVAALTLDHDNRPQRGL